MWTRGAASPRSASPMGPAPTRLPRIALPLATMLLLGVQVSPATQTGAVLAGEALDEAETDDAGSPHQTQRHGEPVEVALGDRRPAHRGGHASSEHVREATALALVQKNQQGQQQPTQDEHHLQPCLLYTSDAADE